MLFLPYCHRTDARSQRTRYELDAADWTLQIKGREYLNGVVGLPVGADAFIPQILRWSRLVSFYMPDDGQTAARAVGQWIRAAAADGSARAYGIVRSGGAVSVLYGNGTEHLQDAFRAHGIEAQLVPAARPIPDLPWGSAVLGCADAARLADTIAGARSLRDCWAAVVMVPVRVGEQQQILRHDRDLADRLEPYRATRRTCGRRDEEVANERVVRALDLLRGEAGMLEGNLDGGLVRAVVLCAAASAGELDALVGLVRSCIGQSGGTAAHTGGPVRCVRLLGRTSSLAVPAVRLPGVGPVHVLSLQPVRTAAGYCLPPVGSYDGCCRFSGPAETAFPVTKPIPAADKSVPIGRMIGSGGTAAIPLDALLGHGCVYGTTRSGKTSTIMTLLRRAYGQAGVSFTVIEPIKKDYVRLAADIPGLRVYGSGTDSRRLLMNPLQPEPGTLIGTHLLAVAQALVAAVPAESPIPAILEGLLLMTYRQFHWQPEELAFEDPCRPWPVFSDVYENIDAFMQTQGRYGPEVRQNITAAIKVRVDRMCRGVLGGLFSQSRAMQAKDILEAPAVIELADLGEGADLVMSVLLFKFYSYLSRLPPSGHLERLVVVEEAHKVFARSRNPLEVSSRTGNVEMLESMLAEIRASGTGLLLADQRPSIMAGGVFANTSVRISHALASAEDRLLMQETMNLTGEQAAALENFRAGECAVSVLGRRGVQHALADLTPAGRMSAACVFCRSRFMCRREQICAALDGMDGDRIRYHAMRAASSAYDGRRAGACACRMLEDMGISGGESQRLCFLGEILERGGVPFQQARIVVRRFLEFTERSDRDGRDMRN